VKSVVVLGAGAAGLFCASILGSLGCKVTVLEHNATAGKKIRISGGGRANFTNRVVTPNNFYSQNPAFTTSALSRYKPEHFCDLVKQHRIAYHEKTLGQLFCDGSAQQIIAMLLSECAKGSVSIRYGEDVLSVTDSTTKADQHSCTVHTQANQYLASAVVVATGGLSIPTLGASGVGYEIAQHAGHTVVPIKPALVPLVASQHWSQQSNQLRGVSCSVLASTNNITFAESMLFTHKGFSGPAMLQISTYLQEASVMVNFLAGVDTESVFSKGDKRKIRTALAAVLPTRLVDTLCEPLWEQAVVDTKKQQLKLILSQLQNYSLPVAGDEGYAKAEVTKGGVSTRELSSKTMQSMIKPYLYFIGEVVDVTGWLGGYNFQWAWASAYAAARAIAERS
jgi:predicted Rossmann fold flavoprotein